MKRNDFNKGWQVHCLTREEPAHAVTLPHDAMREEPRTTDSIGGSNIGWFVGGDYEYMKTFDVPADGADTDWVFEFEGVYHNAEVWLNGEKAAFRPYGYTNFYVAANPYLKFGEANEIKVIARNADQPNSRWYSGTGIYRPVWLWSGSGQYVKINGVQIKTVDYRTGEIEIRVKTAVPGPVQIALLEGEVRTAAAAAGLTPLLEKTFETTEGGMTVRLTVPEAKLWDPDHPNLYTACFSAGEDVVYETFGIRSLTWDAASGLCINGKRVLLKGGCIHHDNGLLGAMSFPEVEDRRVRLHKELGYNALRSAHNPCTKSLLEACDRHGMLMMDEFVDAWYMHKTKYDYVNYLQDWWQEDLKDMVEKDFNHPSVIMYSTGNEVAETAQEKGIAFTREMTEYLHGLDPTRPVSCGINIFFNFLSSIGLGVYSDDKAEKEEKLAEANKAAGEKKKKPVGSEFYNVLAVTLGDKFMKFGATLYPCDLKTKGAYANMDIAGYNYGIWRYRHDMKKYPNRLILGSETFCKDAWLFMDIAKDHPQIIGDFVWASMDYLGECGEGSPEYPDYCMEGKATPLTGGNGRLDLTGKRRAEGSYTKVCFETEVGPYIGVLPPNFDKAPAINGWFVTKAIESWSWDGCEGKTATVEVYSRQAQVELLLNGRPVGKKKCDKTGRTLFQVPYEPGELTAISYDASGLENGRYSLTSASTETQLRVLPESASAKSEGIVYVRLRYTDKNGVWKPLKNHRLRATAENAEILALGCANSYVDGTLIKEETDTYYGEAQVILRAGETGTITLTVSDENGRAETVTLPIEE